MAEYTRLAASTGTPAGPSTRQGGMSPQIMSSPLNALELARSNLYSLYGDYQLPSEPQREPMNLSESSGAVRRTSELVETPRKRLRREEEPQPSTSRSRSPESSRDSTPTPDITINNNRGKCSIIVFYNQQSLVNVLPSYHETFYLFRELLHKWKLPKMSAKSFQFNIELTRNPLLKFYFIIRSVKL